MRLMMTATHFRSGSAVLCAAFVLGSLSPIAAAQTPDASEARNRATRAVDCLERVQAQLNTAVGLLRDAARQTRSGDAAERNDAAAAVVSLEQRIATLSRSVKDCVPQEARLEPRTVVREHTGNEAAVASENSLPAVDRNQRLSRNVLAIVGERVDGQGTVPDANVRSAIRDVAPRLERCYGRLVDRGALETGELVLAFTITTAGRIRDVTVEGATISNGGFQRCVASAGRRLRPGTIARGGNARFAYKLKFGGS